MPACLPRCSCDKVGRAHLARFTTSCTQCFPVVRSRPAHRPRPCCSRALRRPPTPSSWQVRRDVKGLCRTSAGARCHSVSIWGCASLDELGLCGVFRLGQSLGSSVQGTFAARQASAPQRLPSPRSRAWSTAVRRSHRGAAPSRTNAQKREAPLQQGWSQPQLAVHFVVFAFQLSVCVCTPREEHVSQSVVGCVLT